jgi:hypothetical protein
VGERKKKEKGKIQASGIRRNDPSTGKKKEGKA